MKEKKEWTGNYTTMQILPFLCVFFSVVLCFYDKQWMSRQAHMLATFTICDYFLVFIHKGLPSFRRPYWGRLFL